MTLDRAEAARLTAPFYDAFSTGDVAAMDAGFAPDWRDNTLPPGRPPGLPGLQGAVGFVRTVLPDVKAVVEDLRVDRDVVFVRITFTGTDTGGWPGRAPTGRAVRFIAFDMHRVADGRVVESWHLEDNLALLIQLGVVPPLG
jgi:predicted ester cyclase